jgi:hypothetical protein
MKKMFPSIASAAVIAAAVAGCSTEAKELDANQIEQRYGVAGAHSGSIATPGGPMEGMIVPITLADGTAAQLIIPKRQASDARGVYISDNEGLHPVQLKERVARPDVVKAPAIVQRRAEAPKDPKRSWEKEALIIGGSAGGGAAIGAVAGGKKGAAIGAAAGGVGGLIYDVLTRDKKLR